VPRRRFFRVLPLLTSLLLAVCHLDCAAEELRRFSQIEPHMGVEFEIVLFAADEPTAQGAFTAAFARIAKLDEILSDYSLSSELSKLSAAAPTKEPVQLSDDLFTVLQTSQQLAADSDGAFDVTVGPLTKLWRRARRQKEVPAEEQLKTAFAAVGHRFLKLDSEKKTATLEKPGMRLDLGGIAKGYAADQALAVVTRQGITRALVRASGDIAAADPPPGETGWRVGLAPLNPTDPPSVFVALKQQAISTSGEARQHLVVNGKRYSHLIDPRTGNPLTGRQSVTVIAPRGIDADSLASAIGVLGPENGLKLIEGRAGTSAYIITADDDGGNVRTFASKQFSKQ
jgi:thiamine biosynthesis lipoprotein